MARSRLPRIAATAASVGLVALAWVLGAAPQLDAARLAHADTVTVDAANAALRDRLTVLRAHQERVTTIRADVAAARQHVPATPALPDLVDQITAIAAAHGVEVTSYRAEESLAPLSAAVEATPVEITPATSASLVPSGRLSPDNFFAIPVTLSLRGSAVDTLAAIDQIQSGSRLFLVTSARVLAEEPTAVTGSDGGSTEASELRGYVYVLTEG